MGTSVEGFGESFSTSDFINLNFFEQSSPRSSGTLPNPVDGLDSSSDAIAKVIIKVPFQ